MVSGLARSPLADAVAQVLHDAGKSLHRDSISAAEFQGQADLIGTGGIVLADAPDGTLEINHLPRTHYREKYGTDRYDALRTREIESVRAELAEHGFDVRDHTFGRLKVHPPAQQHHNVRVLRTV